MDWAPVQTGIPELLEELLGIPCQWGKQSRKLQTTPAHALCDLSKPRAIGVDERRTETVTIEGEPLIAEMVSGVRHIDLQVSVWSKSQEIDKTADVYLDKLQTRLRWSSSIGILSALGFALVTISDVIEVDPTEESRIVSVSVIEVELAYMHSETDTPATWIETARLQTDELRDAGGTAFPAAMQLDITGPEIP